MEKIKMYCVMLNDGRVERVRCREDELKRLKEYKRIKDYTIMNALSIDNLYKIAW